MKVVIKCTDMPKSNRNHYIEMQIDAVSLAVQAEYNNQPNEEEDINNTSNRYRDIAADIKREFDRKYKSVWHCIVGKLKIYNR